MKAQACWQGWGSCEGEAVEIPVEIPLYLSLGRETPHGCRELLVLGAPGSLRVLAPFRGMGSMSQRFNFFDLS